MRINRFLASAGLGSRRSCEELVQTGQVTINGVLCEDLATTVEPTDVVKVGNRVLHSAASRTILLNKPPGYLCTASDTHNRPTVFDLLPGNIPRLFHVGRLDLESEGLLILTNDGELSLKLTHPRYKVSKEYEVVTNQAFDFTLVPKLLHGMSLEEGWAKAESVYKLAPNKVKVVLKQGLKRQIRKMFYALGYEVNKLVRVRIGPLSITSVEPGHWRDLKSAEIEALLAEGEKNAAEYKERPPRARKPHRFEERGERSDRPERAERSERGGERGFRKFSAEPLEERPRRPYARKPAFRGEESHPVRSRAKTTREKFEEIPFVVRARQKAEDEGERAPRSFSGPKPHKPWLKHKSKGPAPAATSRGPKKPHPFAKFQRRELD